jgi:putative sigma-54 modulation protein
MYASIDKAVDRLRRQLLKFKDHLADVKERGAPARGDVGESDSGGLEKRIVRTETYFYKPMTPEEAAMQLEAIEKGFLVFVDVETDAVAIIYHRRDGNYGLIEPRR